LKVIPLTDGWSARQLFLCAPSKKPLHGAAQLLFEHLQRSGGDEVTV
jgi:hypothetical protein